MMMMPLLVLGAFIFGAFIFGAFIFGAIIVLIYLLRELFYEATEVEKKPRAEEPSDREERLISHHISAGYESVSVEGTTGVEPTPASNIAPTQTSRPSCDIPIQSRLRLYSNPVQPLHLHMGLDGPIRIACEAGPLWSTPHVAARQWHVTTLQTAFNAGEDFVFGDNTSSDSD